MKALGTAERAGGPRFVRQQIYYSLQGREAEYELIPAAVDQGLGYWSGARWPVDCSISCPASGTPGGRRLAVVPACRYRAQDVHPVPPLRRADGMMPVAVVFLDRGAA